VNPDSLTRFCSSALVWIAEPAVRAIVIAGMIAAALWILRVKHLSLQIAAWITVLCAAIALPALGWILPSVFISLPARQMRTHKPAPSLSAALTRPAGVLRTTASATTPVSHSAAANETTKPILPATRAVVGWPVLAFAVYLLGVAFFAGRLCIGLVLTRRMQMRAAPVEDLIPRQWMEHYASEMQLQRLPELLESPAVNVPLTLGLLRTAIVIPENWRTWEDGKLSAVVAHELSHARRRDPVTRILAAAYRSACWFSPLSWWLEHHLAELGERASDQAAISAGTEPTYYAEVLMSFFRDMQNREGRMNWQGARMAGGRRAVERIERVLSSKTLQPSSFKKLHLCLALAGALAVVCLAAAARPRFVLAAQLTSPAVPASPATSPSTAGPPSVPAVSVSAVPSVPAPRSPANVPAVAAVPAPPAIPESGELSTTIQGTIATPAVPSVLLGGIPTPPELAADDGNIMHRNTTLSGAMDFAIVFGGSITMNGSQDDRQAVESLRKKIPGDFIWFIHSGNAYVIRDSAPVQ
jgi:beta-lactamase regulating signal transducer with metallopeptidase domain